MINQSLKPHNYIDSDYPCHAPYNLDQLSFLSSSSNQQAVNKCV